MDKQERKNKSDEPAKINFHKIYLIPVIRQIKVLKVDLPPEIISFMKDSDRKAINMIIYFPVKRTIRLLSKFAFGFQQL